MTRTGSGREDWEVLLGRPSGGISATAVAAAVGGRRVLITGAGGSIGAALAMAVAPYARLLLLDASERALYELDRELDRALPAGGPGDGPGHRLVLGDAGDARLLASLFAEDGPQVVFHAAAFKHVPLLEQNPVAAIANNVLATRTLLEAAGECDDFVLVSTDKAVDPRSIMGASKRVAELLLLAPSQARVRRHAVRLGNVLGSDGSVLLLFLDQLARGVPLTVADPEVRRYFMTVDEAVGALVSAAAAPVSQLSPPATCLAAPELGCPVRILELAQRVLARAGAEPGGGVVFTGLRPGDKLEESLLAGGERWGAPGVAGAGQVGGGLRAIDSPVAEAGVLKRAMRELEGAVGERDICRLLRAVMELVPGYEPSSMLAPYLDLATARAEAVR
ncbi:MAG TPA: polysaccharide biosynthesis protein [Acidobacteriaceae bacterium]